MKQEPEPEIEAVRALAATLAHDLNNLLQVVNGNLELLALRIEDEQLGGYVSNARTAAQQMTAIARDLSRRSGDCLV